VLKVLLMANKKVETQVERYQFIFVFEGLKQELKAIIINNNTGRLVHKIYMSKYEGPILLWHVHMHFCHSYSKYESETPHFCCRYSRCKTLSVRTNRKIRFECQPCTYSSRPGRTLRISAVILCRECTNRKIRLESQSLYEVL
jgi:hypothetical protein